VFTFRSTDSPTSMLSLEAKPSIPPWDTPGLPLVFHAVEPGKQFSTTTAFPEEHVRARGVTCTSRDDGEVPPPTARTA
jgi:hypothetical protein